MTKFINILNEYDPDLLINGVTLVLSVGVAFNFLCCVVYFVFLEAKFSQVFVEMKLIRIHSYFVFICFNMRRIRI